MGGEGEMHYKWPLTGRAGRGEGGGKTFSTKYPGFHFQIFDKKYFFQVFVSGGKLYMCEICFYQNT